MSLDSFSLISFGGVVTAGKLAPTILLLWYLVKIRFRIGLKSYRFFIPLILLFIYFSISALWSPNIALAFPRVFSFLFLFISFWLMSHYIQHQKNGLEYIFQAFILFSVFVALLTLINFAELFSGEAVVRTGAMGMHALHTSTMILSGTIVMIVGLAHKTSNFKFLKLVWYKYLIVFNVVALLSTATKTPIIVLFIIFIVINIYSFYRLTWHTGMKAILLSVAMLVTLSAINPYIGIIDNISNRINIVASKDGVINKFGKGRFLIAEYAVTDAIKNPIFGVGLEGFKKNLIQSEHISIRTSTHNTTLWSFAEGGLIGLLLWLNIVFLLSFGLHRLLKKTKKLQNPEIHELALTSSMLVILFLMLSLSYNIEFNKLFWVIMAIYASTKTALNMKINLNLNLNLN